jgi:hypothetical protein
MLDSAENELKAALASHDTNVLLIGEHAQEVVDRCLGKG